MVHVSTSAAGVRFLGSIKEGRGLKRSAREAGVHAEVGYRWLRERYLRYRRDGMSAADVEAVLGFSSARLMVWEAEVGHSERHHLRVDGDVEKVFWNTYESGSALMSAASVAGVGRSTAYRWLGRRFDELRMAGMSRRRTHQDLTAETGIPIYFAERCSPWQRGANENFNRLARQYFPKGTNLAVHSAAHVAHVTAELNDRPRKGLGYDTPDPGSPPKAPAHQC